MIGSLSEVWPKGGGGGEGGGRSGEGGGGGGRGRGGLRHLVQKVFAVPWQVHDSY